jgi:hypothetical protein
LKQVDEMGWDYEARLLLDPTESQLAHFLRRGEKNVGY